MLAHLNAAPAMADRVVALGAGGFVGRSVVRRLAADGVAVLPLSRAEIDLLAEDAASTLAALLRPSDGLVVISAAVPARSPALLVQDVRMVEVVGEALAKAPVAHVVYVSSDAVYADEANPVRETSCCQPSTLHGMMHAARELVLQTSVRTPLAVLRPSLLYGPGDPHNGYGPNRFRRLAARGEPIVLFGEGEEQRDHVYIDDVAEVISLTLAHRSRGVLNIATGESVPFRRVAELVVDHAPAPVEIRATPRQHPIVHRHFDTVACLKAFPRLRYTPLAEGLRRAALEEGVRA
jgi:UDP-glucose 4-epimerase